MKFVFDAVYGLLLLILSPWIAWRYIVQRKNRRGWTQKLFGFVPRRTSSQRCVWIHAVSVGEVNLLIPLVGEFRARHPEFEIAISTTTETGFDLARKRFPQDSVFFCPADFSWAVANTLNRIRPDLLVLTELELWPNLISVTRSRQIPVVLVNGRISEKSFRGYQRFGFLVRRFVRRINLAIVQSETYAARLIAMGLPPSDVVVCGNIKFDQASAALASSLEKNAGNAELARLANISPQDFVFLAGSTQENEDRICIAVFQELCVRYPQLRMLLVPRHPDRCPRLADILRRLAVPFAFRTGLKPGLPGPANCRVLVVDVIGELAHWWTLANAGYVGGSIGHRGGQSMIEPAACGVPVSFGPNTANFRDVVEMLLAERAAVVVENADQLAKFVENAIREPESAHRMGQRALAVVARQTGATRETVRLISELLERTEKLIVQSQKAA